MARVTTGVLALVWVATTAIAVHAYTDERYGAKLDADCVKPCDDTWIWSVTECDDTLGEVGKCDKTQCTINSIRYLKCTPPAGGSGEVLCGWKINNGDWNRWIVVRKMPCTDKGPWSYEYPRCVGSPYKGESTPCLTDQCNGELVEDKAEEWGRPIC